MKKKTKMLKKKTKIKKNTLKEVYNFIQAVDDSSPNYEEAKKFLKQAGWDGKKAAKLYDEYIDVTYP